MENFTKEAWLHIHGGKRTRSILDGTETNIRDGDVKAITGTCITDGALILWDTSRPMQYANKMPQTKERITDIKKIIAPVVSTMGIALPETITNRMRVQLGRKFVLAIGFGQVAMTSTDIDCDSFMMQDGAELESDGFLGGYDGKPIAHGWLSNITEKIMRRFACSHVEILLPWKEKGAGVLKFEGTYRGKPLSLALLNCRLDPGDEDHALDLVREWGK